ncbi:Panacea domain-containing protein [Actinomyces faecalis]|uniref:Panacea domain-containing protein n=1 Tax=Actinomyces faecalis TaxID=2722820 RepID=UPI001557414A|nr:type II toxin-antitoxin system antitoxin SocA domain-containing protein [Actinomyces faecalis]
MAADLMSEADWNEIGTVKLQKLAYYTFGWYGYLTGTSLFDQQFYAMPHGPVVGELLSLHAGTLTVSRDRVESARSEFDDTYVEPDAYYERVVEAVTGFYGAIDQWVLRDMTHEDEVWKQAWEGRGKDSRRAPLPQKKIIDFFARRDDMPAQLQHTLPPRAVTILDEAAWSDLQAMLESDPQATPRGLV